MVYLMKRISALEFYAWMLVNTIFLFILATWGIDKKSKLLEYAFVATIFVVVLFTVFRLFEIGKEQSKKLREE